MIKQCVLVSLDALLDTRLSTVSKINQDAAEKLLLSEDYFTRLNDDFEKLTGITQEQFREAYAKRDVDTLQGSIMTVIPLLLHDLISKLEVNAAESPYTDDTEVVINYWPYELDEDEIEGLTTSIMVFSGVETLVRFVSIHPMELTPDHVKTNYTGMILYDFREWFEYHQDKFAVAKMPGVTVLAPALFYGKIPTPEEYLTEGVNPQISPFQLAEMALIDCFSLQLLRPELFSIRKL